MRIYASIFFHASSCVQLYKKGTRTASQIPEEHKRPSIFRLFFQVRTHACIRFTPGQYISACTALMLTRLHASFITCAYLHDVCASYAYFPSRDALPSKVRVKLALERYLHGQHMHVTWVTYACHVSRAHTAGTIRAAHAYQRVMYMSVCTCG